MGQLDPSIALGELHCAKTTTILAIGVTISLRLQPFRRNTRMDTTLGATGSPRAGSWHQLGVAWVLLVLSLAVHVTDEALTGFLPVYNPTVLALRAKFGFWPMPPFAFRDWLTGLILGVVLLLALSPFVFRGSRWIRPLFYFLVVMMLFNGMGHTLATIFGQTVSSVHFPRPAPGFYSSPLLFAASIYGFVQLRRTR
jgi:hypothetical protein